MPAMAQAGARPAGSGRGRPAEGQARRAEQAAAAGAGLSPCSRRAGRAGRAVEALDRRGDRRRTRRDPTAAARRAAAAAGRLPAGPGAAVPARARRHRAPGQRGRRPARGLGPGLPDREAVHRASSTCRSGRRCSRRSPTVVRTGEVRTLRCGVLTADGMAECEVTACPVQARGDSGQLLVAVGAPGARAGPARPPDPLARGRSTARRRGAAVGHPPPRPGDVGHQDPAGERQPQRVGDHAAVRAAAGPRARRVAHPGRGAPPAAAPAAGRGTRGPARPTTWPAPWPRSTRRPARRRIRSTSRAARCWSPTPRTRASSATARTACRCSCSWARPRCSACRCRTVSAATAR